MQQHSKIVVVGSSNIDFIMKMPRLPRVGETVLDAIFMQTYGGKGANQATAAARAGGEVWFVASVGNGDLTDRMVGGFKRDGIHADFIFRDSGSPSGTALVMIGENGANYLSVASGANYCLDRRHVDKAASLFDESSVAVFQNEIRPDTLRYAMEEAKDRRATVLLNFAPARSASKDLLDPVSILVVNHSEAEMLTGREFHNESQTADAAQSLIERGPETVIITLGSEGVWVSSRELKKRIPSFKVEVVDTTAAGDTFCGAFAVGLTEYRALQPALRFASAAAALSVTKMGAQPSIPTRSEIDAFLEAHKEGM